MTAGALGAYVWVLLLYVFNLGTFRSVASFNWRDDVLTSNLRVVFFLEFRGVRVEIGNVDIISILS